MSSKSHKRKTKKKSQRKIQNRRLTLIAQAGILLVAIVLFLWNTRTLNFIQDDSYITYRYVRNMFRGWGPVFNFGENVEGYTNFLWMMLLHSLGWLKMSLDSIITASLNIGIFLGIATLLLVFFFSKQVFSSGPYAILSVFFLIANGAFVCWSTSGMETVMFAFLITLSAFAYLVFKRPQWKYGITSLCFGIASLARPEAYFLWGMTFLHALFMILRRHSSTRDRLRSFLYLTLPYVILVVPHFVWRYSFYGALLPNTFYAKTGFGMSYLATGFDSIWRFLKHYGFYGIGLLLPFITLRKKIIKIDSPYFYITYLLVGYCIYIILLGGNVLQIHRFYVPIVPIFYLFLQEGIYKIPLNKRVRTVIVIVIAIALLALTHFLPRKHIQHNREREIGLVTKMTLTGRWLNQVVPDNECIAASTIGAVSYYSDKTLIDMLGLTDAYIARNPEHLEGIRATWRERNYNTKYLLERNPLFVYFSTGIKPSAPAERALFLRKRFRTGYYPYYFQMNRNPRMIETIFKKKPFADTIPLTVEQRNPNFINLYYDAIQAMKRNKHQAINKFKEVINNSPEDFAYPYEWIGRIYEMLGKIDSAYNYYQAAVKIDDYCIISHARLGAILMKQNKLGEAAGHFEKALEYDPDQFEPYWWLSIIYEHQGKKEKALTLLERATKIIYGFPDFYLRLASLNFDCGNLAEAERIVSAILNADPNNEQARQLMTKIQNQ